MSERDDNTVETSDGEMQESGENVAKERTENDQLRNEPDEQKGDTDKQPEDKSPPPMFKLFQLRGSQPEHSDIEEIVCEIVQDTVNETDLAEEYNIVVLYDMTVLLRSDADRIYRALSDIDEEKPTLMILNSRGGDVAAAYLTGKICREASTDRFVIAVPRRAKSAATLICCAADEIHMGSLSELGPIDPQIEQVPALALKYSIQHIAELSSEYPGAGQMFSDYLSQSLNIEVLGHYERVAESATQYAVRLLKSRVNASEQNAVSVAERLVYQYKDHGFVIDSNESSDIFGSDVIKLNTDEYKLGNALFNKLSFLNSIIEDFFGRKIHFTGGIEDGCNVISPAP